jgi:formate dehydrogenase alpha subunit
MVNLKIDGKEVQVAHGATILAAAEKLGIHIPTLCFLKKISPTGACRICVVEVAGADKPMTACNTPAVEGMVVTTRSEKLAAIRRQVVELLLVNHPVDCPVCDAGGECDLQNVCYDLDVTRQPFAAEDVSHPVINDWRLIQQVPSRCILCEKCVKVCHEVVGASAIVVRERGERAFIDTHDGKPLDCEFCGNCVDECPTGTLLSKPFLFKSRPWELTRVPSVCTYCGSQCQIDVGVKQNRVLRVTSEDGTTVNDGTLCIGGYFGHGFIHSPQRLTRPQLKRGDGQQTASWDEALGAVAERLRQTPPNAVAALGSPRLTNEENYLFQKFFRVAVGTNNLDSEARFGALRAAKALDAALGLRGASNRIGKIGQAEAVLVFGSDVTAEAPAIDWQIELACRKRDGKLVVANLRRVKLVRYAESFLQYRPGSETLLANALTRVIVDRGLADEAFLQRHVKNLDEMRAHLQQVDLDRAAEATGLSRAQIEEAALHLGRAASVAIVFGGDVTRSEGAEAKVAALANLALVSGALHGDLGGLFPVDEKGNTLGLLDMGVAPELLPGGQDYRSAREKFAAAWGVQLPEGGRDAQAILEGIEQGSIKLLYLAATNPLVSFPDAGRWRRALAKVEFLVVQDIQESGLTAMAHAVLPGVSFAEKSGTFTALDGRIGCVNRAIAPLGEARPDSEIFADLFVRLRPGADRPQARAVLDELRRLTPLFTEVCTADATGCRTCLREPYRPAEKGLAYTPVEGTAGSGGLQLLTGKILFHFGTTSTFAPANLEVAPAGYIALNPADADACGVKEGDRIKVTSATGTAQAPARITDSVPPGLLFAPYHFADVAIQQVIPGGANLVAVQIAKA